MHDDPRPDFLRNFCGKGQGPKPERLGIRLDESGTFLSEPGNTVVCHVVPDSPTQRAMIKVRDRLRELDRNGHFAWTPVSSYHMTVFNGVIESQREQDHWPAELALEASIADTTHYLMPRLTGARPAAPFSVKLDRITPFGLRVSGATSGDQEIIKDFRERLAQRFGYRKPDHDSYGLHLTMAYIVRWLPSEAVETYLPALQQMTAAFQAEVPVLELGPADFCTFENMNHFEPVLRLS